MNASGGRAGRRAVLVAGLVLILGGFGYLLYGGIGSNLVYFLTPTELLGKGEGAYDTPLRLGGQVVPGSVQWNADELDLRFQVTDGETVLAVHSTGAPPQMFRDGIGVVVEGRFKRDGVFASTNLMVKHSNEYRAPHDGEDPEEMYRSLVRDGGS
jgi:cytochrome c-type biogenesis protein CcmE